MKNWFKCFECGEYFEDPKEKLPEVLCPVCGSSDTSEVETCKICGGPVKDTVEEICVGCQNKLVKAINYEVTSMFGDGIDLADAIDAAWDYLADVIRNR